MAGTRSRAAPKAEVDALLAGYEPSVGALARSVRAWVRKLVPEAIEQVDRPAHMLAYGFSPTYRGTICVVQLHRAGVNLGFPLGTQLADPLHLLTGTGKRARHVRITDRRQLVSPALRSLLKASVAATPR